MGDAAGIGPEIIIKATMGSDILRICDPIVIGSARTMALMNEALGCPAALAIMSGPGDGEPSPGTIRILDCDVEENKHFRWGAADGTNGKNSIAHIGEAVRLASSGLLDGFVIAPLNKEALHLAGCTLPDEGALLQEEAGVSLVKLVLKWDQIFRSSVVGHTPFRDIVANLTQDRIVKTVEHLGNTIRLFLASAPRIGVAALNPHAGEGGAFGDEEATILTPAVEEARRFGFVMSGPYPADTILLRAKDRKLDGIVYLYHDQGNIALKAAAFGESVIIYSGLPFPVTGPGHGTAYGRAGKGYADPRNLQEAIRVCAEMARKKRFSGGGNAQQPSA